MQNAGHLEAWYGARIREHAEARSLGAEDPSAWLEASAYVKASVITLSDVAHNRSEFLWQSAFDAGRGKRPGRHASAATV